VCTPSGAEDMFLYHVNPARACLTGLEHLGLTRGPFASGEADTSWPNLSAHRSTGTDLHALPASPRLMKLEVHRAWYRSWHSWTGFSAITELCLDGIILVRDPDMTALPLTSLGSIWLQRMLSLTVLKLADLQHLSNLSVVAVLPALSTLVITRCTGLTSAGCARLGSMHSLTELSFTTCGPVTLPSLRALTRLVTLHIDLHDNEDYASCVDTEIDDDDASHGPSCFTEIPEIPLSLRRLRFNSENSLSALRRPQLEYMGRRMAMNPQLTELSISYWDGTWFWGIDTAPHF